MVIVLRVQKEVCKNSIFWFNRFRNKQNALNFWDVTKEITKQKPQSE